jgi:hypothetical protein
MTGWLTRDLDPTNQRDPGAHIGRLIRRKHLSNVEMYYCPASGKTVVPRKHQQPGRASLQLLLQPTPPHTHRQRQRAIRSSGGRNCPTTGSFPQGPSHVMYGGGGANSERTDWVFRPVRYALATDPIYELSQATHSQGDTRAWNLLYADGSVKDRSGRFANGARDSGSWPRLLDLLGHLERVADGVPVQTPPQWNDEYKRDGDRGGGGKPAGGEWHTGGDAVNGIQGRHALQGAPAFSLLLRDDSNDRLEQRSAVSEGLHAWRPARKPTANRAGWRRGKLLSGGRPKPQSLRAALPIAAALGCRVAGARAADGEPGTRAGRRPSRVAAGAFLSWRLLGAGSARPRVSTSTRSADGAGRREAQRVRRSTGGTN